MSRDGPNELDELKKPETVAEGSGSWRGAEKHVVCVWPPLPSDGGALRCSLPIPWAPQRYGTLKAYRHSGAKAVPCRSSIL